MDAKKDPGIEVEIIRLLSSEVRMLNIDGKREYNLQLTTLGRSEDGNNLDLHAAFDLMHGIEKPLFEFKCEFLARYSRQDESNMTWNDFPSPVALAHIIPYLREFVSNITNRLPVPVLMLNPINTYAMVATYEKHLQDLEEAKTAATAQKQAEL